MSIPPSILGAILAGGLSSRMGGPEKTLMELDGKPMLAHVRDRLQKQVDAIVLNANGDPDRFSAIGLPIVKDHVAGFAGPLAGVHAAMKWARANMPEKTHVLTVAGDTPFFPDMLCTKLAGAVQGETETTIALAYSDSNRHPTFGLWPIALAGELEAFLEAGDRKVMLFAQRYNLQKVDFELIAINNELFDPFFNINTPEDFARAEELTGKLQA